MSQSSSIAALILAGGRSSRMAGGNHKLLLPLGDRPVLGHVIEAALTSQARPIIVVLGYQAEYMRQQLSAYSSHPAIILVENRDYQQGMSTSLHTGLQRFIQDNNTERKSPYSPTGALVLLGDQPFVTALTINTLIEAQQQTGKGIVIPLYEGKRGNPVLFMSEFFAKLLEVTGDEGGRSVIRQHPSEVLTLELGSSMAYYDVDTWEAYQHALHLWQTDDAK